MTREPDLDNANVGRRVKALEMASSVSFSFCLKVLGIEKLQDKTEKRFLTEKQNIDCS